MSEEAWVLTGGILLALMFLYLSSERIPADKREQWVQRLADAIAALDQERRRAFAHGLAEVREYLADRDPGIQTMVAVSLWEEAVALLPLPAQYLAREGEAPDSV